MSYLIALSKDVASLRVTQDHPVHTAVLDHRRAARMELELKMKSFTKKSIQIYKKFAAFIACDF